MRPATQPVSGTLETPEKIVTNPRTSSRVLFAGVREEADAGWSEEPQTHNWPASQSPAAANGFSWRKGGSLGRVKDPVNSVPANQTVASEEMDLLSPFPNNQNS
jgi:hypothetical protein